MMKLLLFAMVVMFKCSRLSSAPTDAQSTSSNNNKSTSDPFSLTELRGTPNVAYVSEDEDFGKTGVVFQFRRSIKSDNTEIEARRRSAIDKGFMRFGRSKNVARFGRSNPDIKYDNEDNDLERDDNDPNEPMRMRRGNMMRFGRSYPKERGSSVDNVDYGNDASEVFDFVDLPIRRSPELSSNNYDEHGKKILRLGRSSSESYSDENINNSENQREKRRNDGNLIRFGRGNMMRFGRNDKNMVSKNDEYLRAVREGNVMRFGRSDKNMMRFGRGNMMRFGKRSDKSLTSNNDDYMRAARAGNVMRFGRSDRNPMRFGKRSSPQEIAMSSRIYCEDGKCLIQQNENRLIDDNQKSQNLAINNNEDLSGDQLSSLFGDDDTRRGYGEYILSRK